MGQKDESFDIFKVFEQQEEQLQQLEVEKEKKSDQVRKISLGMLVDLQEKEKQLMINKEENYNKKDEQKDYLNEQNIQFGLWDESEVERLQKKNNNLSLGYSSFDKQREKDQISELFHDKYKNEDDKSWSFGLKQITDTNKIGPLKRLIMEMDEQKKLREEKQKLKDKYIKDNTGFTSPIGRVPSNIDNQFTNQNKIKSSKKHLQKQKAKTKTKKKQQQQQKLSSFISNSSSPPTKLFPQIRSISPNKSIINQDYHNSSSYLQTSKPPQSQIPPSPQSSLLQTSPSKNLSIQQFGLQSSIQTPHQQQTKDSQYQDSPSLLTFSTFRQNTTPYFNRSQIPSPQIGLPNVFPPQKSQKNKPKWSIAREESSFYNPGIYQSSQFIPSTTNRSVSATKGSQYGTNKSIRSFILSPSIAEAGADGAAHRQQSVLQRTLKVAEAKVQAAQAQRREAQRQKRLAEKAEKEIHNQFKDVMINKTKQKVYTQDIMRQIEENKAAMKDLQLIYAQEENEKQKLQQQVRLLEKSRLHDTEQWEKFSKKKQGGNF